MKLLQLVMNNQVLLEHGEEIVNSDEFGRSTGEAAIIYCSSDVIKIILDASEKDTDLETDQLDYQIKIVAWI